MKYFHSTMYWLWFLVTGASICMMGVTILPLLGRSAPDDDSMSQLFFWFVALCVSEILRYFHDTKRCGDCGESFSKENPRAVFKRVPTGKGFYLVTRCSRCANPPNG